jgi:preprotein translocase subunit YajC
MRDCLALLFQASPSTPAAQPNPMLQMLPLMAALLLVMYLMVFRPQRKQQAQRQEMLKNLKKNDRVVTTNGMYGVVAALSDDDVTLKIDEQNNVRARFSKSAIAAVLGKEDEAETEAVKK